VIDEGTSTCVMASSFWQALGSPELTLSPTLLTAFNGRSFKPHEIIPSFSIQLGGKIVSVEVEVVNAAINYIFLLGRSWTYAMTVIMSYVFRVVHFPHEGNIIMINQLYYTRNNPNTSAGSNILSIENSSLVIKNVGVGLYPSLMGYFNISYLVLFIGSSSTSAEKEAFVSVV